MKKISLRDLPNVPTPIPSIVEKKILIKPGEVENFHQFGRVVFGKGEGITPHAHDNFIEIMYVEDGRAIMHVGDKDIPIQKGDCITVGIGEIHSLVVENEEPFILLFFGIYS